jgi:hypothetical protein
MKKCRLILFSMLLLLFLGISNAGNAQCSICTRTAQQMGEKPAKGMNLGIIYLALTPFAIVGVVGYRWWKDNQGEK